MQPTCNHKLNKGIFIILLRFNKSYPILSNEKTTWDCLLSLFSSICVFMKAQPLFHFNRSDSPGSSTEASGNGRYYT